MKKAFVIVLVLIGTLSVMAYRKHDIEYAHFLSYTIPEGNRDSGAIHRQGAWEILSKNGFYRMENFEADFLKETGKTVPDSFDTEQNTYVICYGTALEKLFYREAEMSGRFTSDTPYYYANAVLKKTDPNEVNIYLVSDKIAIDRDIHTGSAEDRTLV